MAKNYIEDAYIEGLNKDQIEFMKVFNLKVFAERAGISYNLLRKGVKGKKIPRSVDDGIWAFLSKLDVKIKKTLSEKQDFSHMILTQSQRRRKKVEVGKT